WAGAEYWEAQARQDITLESIIERSEVITVGIDGGGLDDLLGLAVVGRERGTRRWLAWCRAWAHPSVLQRRKEIAPRLLDFAKSGQRAWVEEIGETVGEVPSTVFHRDQAGVLPEAGLDPAGLGARLEALVGMGTAPEKVVGVSHRWRMRGATETTERKLA